MRTFSAFALSFLSVAAVMAQPGDVSANLQRLEKRIETQPNDFASRESLLRVYYGAVNSDVFPIEAIRDGRRVQIFWLIEHRPQSVVLGRVEGMISPKGSRLSDRDGFSQEVALWKSVCAKADVKTEVVENAVLALMYFDRTTANELLDAARREHPGDVALDRARGALDAVTLAGVTGIAESSNYGFNAALRDSPEANAALAELEGSQSAPMLGGAATELARMNPLPPDVVIGHSTRPELVERYLRRAIAIAPEGQSDPWKSALSQALRGQAANMNDPREKVRLLKEAMALFPPKNGPGPIAELAGAEFDVGDDESAARDAQAALESGDKDRNNIVQAANLRHHGEIVLGRIALARGDREEAKRRLFESLKTVEGTNALEYSGPDRTLAQDLANQGERDTVVSFFEQSRKLWKYDRGQIDRLIAATKKSPSPDLLRFNGYSMPFGPPPSFKLKDLEGKTWSLENAAGKPLALVFFRPDCERCIEETFPQLEAALPSFTSDGGAVVAIGYGSESDVRRAAESGQLTIPVLIDHDGAIWRHYQIDTSPTVLKYSENRNQRGNLTGFGGGNALAMFLRPGPLQRLDTPVPTMPADGAEISAKNVELKWDTVVGAESYLVEWDWRDEKGWVMDREKSVRIIPTRDTSVKLDLPETSAVRWRVVAVPRFGEAGKPSDWREIRIVPNMERGGESIAVPRASVRDVSCRAGLALPTISRP